MDKLEWRDTEEFDDDYKPIIALLSGFIYWALVFARCLKGQDLGKLRGSHNSIMKLVNKRLKGDIVFELIFTSSFLLMINTSHITDTKQTGTTPKVVPSSATPSSAPPGSSIATPRADGDVMEETTSDIIADLQLVLSNEDVLTSEDPVSQKKRKKGTSKKTQVT
jgi:hypothetical protein